jgi:hypothetical protein
VKQLHEDEHYHAAQEHFLKADSSIFIKMLALIIIQKKPMPNNNLKISIIKTVGQM